MNVRVLVNVPQNVGIFIPGTFTFTFTFTFTWDPASLPRVYKTRRQLKSFFGML